MFVGCVTHNRDRVERVRDSPVELQVSAVKYIHLILLAPVELAPYQTKYVSVPPREAPRETLIYFSLPRFSYTSKPHPVKVRPDGCVYIPLYNATLKEREYK